MTSAVLMLLISAALSPTLWADGRDKAHAQAPLRPFTVSTEKPFSELMHDSMAIMDQDMREAPMNGDPDHDFVTMMIPHHQGAIDMAKVLLLYGKDPELRNLAQQIITDQQTEINIMRAWLKRHNAKGTESKRPK